MEKYRKSYDIRSYECNQYKELRLVCLINLFQDVADEHADLMGVGYDFCVAKRVGWVGANYHVRIDRLPRWEEKITINTWPSDATTVSGIRDFQIVDERGNPIIVATSQWAMVDLERMRPTAVKKVIPEYEVIPERMIDTSFPKIPELERIDFIKNFDVRLDDIDVNKHVNNAMYPLWASEGVPPDFVQNKHVNEIEISFKRSAVFGDSVRIQTQLDGMQSVHSIVSATEPDKEFARVRMMWKEIH